MSVKHYLTTPLSNQDLEKLQTGDKVFLSGILYTARDAAHKRLAEAIIKGEKLPFDLKGQALYFVGPAPARPGKIIGSAGPTTSYRMDPYSPLLLEQGLKAMIGKGDRSQPVIDAIKSNKSIYFAAVGGAAVVTAKCVRSVEIIAYPDLGTEAVHKMEVENLPLFVAIDSRGNNIFDSWK
jgi:fumarate hydratase subunit beta